MSLPYNYRSCMSHLGYRYYRYVFAPLTSSCSHMQPSLLSRLSHWRCGQWYRPMAGYSLTYMNLQNNFGWCMSLRAYRCYSYVFAPLTSSYLHMVQTLPSKPLRCRCGQCYHPMAGYSLSKIRQGSWLCCNWQNHSACRWYTCGFGQCCHKLPHMSVSLSRRYGLSHCSRWRRQAYNVRMQQPNSFGWCSCLKGHRYYRCVIV